MLFWRLFDVIFIAHTVATLVKHVKYTKKKLIFFNLKKKHQTQLKFSVNLTFGFTLPVFSFVQMTKLCLPLNRF